MKKVIIIICITALMLQSCASIFTASAPDECQRCRPQPYEAGRKIRWGFFILDVIASPLVGGLPLLIDFGNTKIYKPCQQNSITPKSVTK